MLHLIYADHAATTAVSDTALQAMLPHFTAICGDPSSLYRFAQEGRTDLERARAEIAACLNTRPEEIYFTSGGTETDNWALRGVTELMALERRESDHVITSAIEHHAVLHTAQYLEKQGYEITYLPVGGRGLVDPVALERAIRPDATLISIMTTNSEIGTIGPVTELDRITRVHKVLSRADAMQAVDHIPVNVETWNMDLLSLSAHKFHGPRGMGALYVKKPLRLPTLIQGSDQRKGHRPGIENVPGTAGMAATLQETVNGPSQESSRLAALRDRFIDGLTGLPYTHLIGDPVNRLPDTASSVFEGVEGEALLSHLDARGICVPSGSAYSSASLDLSHVLLATGLPRAIAYGSLRLSPDTENTEADVDCTLKEVPQMVAHLRKLSPIQDRDAQKPTWEL